MILKKPDIHKPWEVKAKEIVLLLLEGKKTETDLLKHHDFDKRDSKPRPFIEVPFLRKKSMDLFSKFLKILTLPTRRRVLLDKQSTGYTQHELTTMYKYNEHSGMGSARIGKFIRNEQKTFDPRFIADMAILCRVPKSWLTQERTDDEWETEYFKDTQSLCEVSSFIDMLQKALKETTERRVAGLILQLNVTRRLFLRIQTENRGLLVEIFNTDTTVNDLFELSAILKPFNCAIFRMPSVVSSQIIYLFLSKNYIEVGMNLPDELNVDTNPIEFKL